VLVIYIILGSIIALAIYRWFIGKPTTKGSVGIEVDAGRFARLLIAEIRLTETYKLQRGINQKDIYGSLKDEIEAARKKFGRRFPQKHLGSAFEEQIVDVLAGGDRSKMGAEFLVTPPTE
jgi:hypothetical protein